jgi:hypothetical protein
MNTVRIVHPEAGETHVPESAVRHWRSSGWEVAEDKPTEQAQKDTGKQPKTDDDPASDKGGSSKPSGNSRRRTNEGD